MKLSSSAFKQGEVIPEKYSAHGLDVSPPLFFHDVPKETKSFALIVDDPDAPMGTFVHWLAWNISADTTELSEGIVLPKQGTNDYKQINYGGPCPPPGPMHRYFFKLYALNSLLDLPQGATKEKIEKAMQGHILEKAELIGTFQNKKS